jgi:hypothetical protein
MFLLGIAEKIPRDMRDAFAMRVPTSAARR